MPNQYTIGQLVTVDVLFTDSSDNLQDPAEVFLDVTTPDDSVTTYTYLTDNIVVRDSLGTFHADLDANVSGSWNYRWYSTGSGQAADKQTFYVLFC